MDPVDHFNTQAKEGIPTALTLKENVNYSAKLPLQDSFLLKQ
jgi:hypothetical protein